MVKAISDAELIRAAELVVHLGKHIFVANRVGINAGRNRRAGIPDGREPCIDRGHIRRRDGGEAGLVQVAPFEVREIEGAVAHDRAAQARTVLRLREGKREMRERIRGIQPLIAEVTI